MAFVNRGGVRAPGFPFTSRLPVPDGSVTYAQAFTAQPFGNSLVTMTLTAQDLKDVLEQQFAGCRGQSASATRLMLPSAGFRYTWDGSKPCDARVSNMSLTVDGAVEVIVDENGRVPDPDKAYRVTVNNFMASGGDGLTIFRRGTASVGGAQDIDALVAYLGGFRPPRAAYDPTASSLQKPRIKRVNAPEGSARCPVDANVNP
ncbi:MAG TPA: 5'-nucleotidase [Burkholderiaceae bacterium]|nr:5'-nucleotidase [Burkholderiaceae bacterium]